MNILPIPTTESIYFKTNIPTFERLMQTRQIDIVRKKTGIINVTIDYIKETVTVGKTTYKTSYNGEYTYRKSRGNSIECLDFMRFANLLKTASEPSNLWNKTLWGFLLNLSKNNIDKIEC